MSNKRIIYTVIGDDVPTKVEVPSTSVEFEDILIMVQARPDASNIRVITTDDLPSHRHYRNAWDDSNSENFVSTDINKAKIIAHERRRINRAKLLTPLDEEDGFISTKQVRKDAILLEKQAILDANAVIQVSIDSTVDVEELLAIEEAEGFL